MGVLVMSKPIRVMHVMGHMMGGGVEATVMNHYRHIDRNRVQFDFIIDSDSTVVPREEIEMLGGHIFVVPPYRRIHEYCNACENIFSEQKPDIVHSNINALSVFPLAAAKRSGVPIRIAHSHSTGNPKEFTKTLLKNLLRPFSRVEPTHLAACSTYSGRWLFGDDVVDAGKVHIIKNAIELNKFSFNDNVRQNIRKSLYITNDQLVIGQVGRICFQKNQLFTLDVFAQILSRNSNAILVIVGDGEMMDIVRRKADNLEISDSVKFLGIRNDVFDLYQAFDILMFPSTYEGLPLTGIEAQASGLPVLTSTNVSEEVILVKKLVRRLELTATARRWATVLLEMAYSKDMSRTGQAKILTERGYSIEDSADKLCKWYEQLYFSRNI